MHTIDLQEPCLLLLVLGDLDLVHAVREPELLERDADLLAVGRAGGVAGDMDRCVSDLLYAGVRHSTLQWLAYRSMLGSWDMVSASILDELIETR